MLAKGEFTVNLNPQADDDFAAGRLSIDKNYQGDLIARGKGQMLSHRSVVEGSAGYVAIEKVSGELAGKHGTFYLQHSGTMNKGEQSLSVTIIPDSGSEELLGITGSLRIIIEDGKHFYELDYEICD